MDIDDPCEHFKYVDFENEMRKFGIRGILDVHNLPRMVLAEFGSLGWYGANHLHAYIKERLLPLIKPGEKRVAGGSKVEGYMASEESGAVKESDRIPSLWKGKGPLLKEESKEAIIEWPSDDEEELQERQSLPPIEVLDDDDDASTESSGFF